MKEVIWSVNILIGLGLIAVAWVLYYILTLDENEKDNSSNTDSSKTHH